MPKKDVKKPKKERKAGGAGAKAVPKKKTLKKTEKAQASPHEFPIVGIGASAGGLEAFEQFFLSMPPDTGMSFVLVPHLDPSHKSILSDLLKRYTKMPVLEVEDGMMPAPDSVYIIPPNRDIRLSKGRLRLYEPETLRGMRHPIDRFFRSLAEDQKEKAICVVLSGTGTEGALGLKAVKGEGGMCMVQDPATAKYSGMPVNAIATDVVDFVLPPQNMPEQLISYVSKSLGRMAVRPSEVPSVVLQRIFDVIKQKTGHNFSFYKQNMVVRRVARRMAVKQLDRMSDYAKLLEGNAEEVRLLFRELLIGVTNFFRDPDAFHSLKASVIKPLVEKKDNSTQLRAWVPGCSTGEEAYTIAMLFMECMKEAKKDLPVQIFATDIDAVAIERARIGVYPESIGVDVSEERLRRFFAKRENSYQIKKEVREMVVFAEQSAIKDPPFTKLDLVSCRNLLIYLGAELQKKLLPLFHYTLIPGGYLFLGTSETIGGFTDLYETVDKKNKIYQRKGPFPEKRPAVELRLGDAYPPAEKRGKPRGAAKLEDISLREVAERLLLDGYAPPSVIISREGDILYIYGRVADYLEVTPGEPSSNVQKMAKDGLKLELGAAIHKAALRREKVSYEGLHMKQDGRELVFNLIVTPVTGPEPLKGLMMVVFDELYRTSEGEKKAGALAKGTAGRAGELERELKATKEYLQSTIEELEASNEDLKSTNEELQSANEELQSTNEELETSKEELQSVNEELVTVNSELQSNVDELSRVNNDMNNFLASTRIATVFLDGDLRIRRFTPDATRILNLIQTDVGRPVSDIATNILYPGLVKDAHEVLKTLDMKETVVKHKEDKWFLARILPYRTLSNAIDGVVITFVDITDQKKTIEDLSLCREDGHEAQQ